MRYGLRQLLYAGICAILLLQFENCSNDINLTEFDNSDFPAAPRGLQVLVGDGGIVLAWTHPDAEEIELYRIYRRSNLDTTLTLVDSTVALTYTDRSVNNGVSYRYAVAAVKGGFEGARTLSVEAVPTVFGVTINSGDEFTGSRSVVLTLISPPGTSFMRISNDSAFSSAQWEPYNVNRAWTLTEGDGKKTVYAHFRDAAENETFEAAVDSIVLDTKANILQVTENTNGQTLQAGDVIHFSLNSGEPKGNASVDIGQARTNIRLFDDATNGDPIADDGVYHRDFQIPATLEVNQESVIGHFTDRLGNVAETLEADGLITIQNPPTIVTLLAPEPIQGSTTSLRLTWTQSSDQDFASYKLYRATAPNVTQDAAFVTSIESVNTLSFVDENLNENTVYYYRLYVFDTSGRSSPSNEVSGSTAQNEPPTAVTLSQPEITEGASTSLRLSWTQNTDVDFASYKLYRADSPNVSTSSNLVTTVASQATLSFLDEALEENTTYYYRLYVFDSGGLSTASNEVNATTPQNEAPTEVTLFDPEAPEGSSTTLRLAWTQNNDADFASYKLYRSMSPNVTTSSTFLASFESQATLSYLDESLQENTTYYYKLYVFDAGGLSTASNEVNGTTLQNEPPIAVTLFEPEAPNGSSTTLRLSWTQNNDPDFASYKLYRAVSPNVTTGSTFLTSFEARTSLSYVDENLQENTTYYYKLYVFDSGGLSTASNEVSGATLQNEPPVAVTLFDPEAPNGASTALRLSWTQNNDPDFASYKLYRATSPPVTTGSTLVHSEETQANLSFLDENLQENTTYYYKLYVFDRGGLSSESNEVSATTPENEPPKAVTVTQPAQVNDSTLRLAWSRNFDDDFESYRIFRSTTSPVDTTQAPVAIINSATTTTYDDSDLETQTDYFYRVFVWDRGGLFTGSNEVTGRLD